MRRLAYLLALVALFPLAARAEPPDFSASLKLLGSGGWQKPTLTDANRDNVLLNMPGRVAMVQARLDLSLGWERLNLFARPRAEWEKKWWTDGPDKGEADADAEPFLTEGGVRWAAFDSLHLSLARENLQWGPSQFVSPSNPFFFRNGRGNPMKELRGGDFVRAVWIPNSTWALSWIGNISRGEQEMGTTDWRPSHAGKLDYTGVETSGALIVHGGSQVPASLRGYCQWTASDALLLYGEWSLAEGNRQYYPVPDISPTGGYLARIYDEGGHFLPVALAGGAYTVEAGPTLSLEYLYNGEGYNASQADLFHTIATRALPFIEQGYIDRPESEGLGDVPMRRNYLFLQYLQTEVFNKATLILRLTGSLDDGSSVLTAYADYALSDHFTLFGFGGVWLGEADEEYGMAVRRNVTVGIEYAAF